MKLQPATPETLRAFEHLMVVDLEATCWETRRDDMETIEFGAVTLRLSDLAEVGTRTWFVRRTADGLKLLDAPEKSKYLKAPGLVSGGGGMVGHRDLDTPEAQRRSGGHARFGGGRGRGSRYRAAQ